MKVFELMNELANLPAGANVMIQENDQQDWFDIESVDAADSPDTVMLVGNRTLDEESEEGE